MFAGIKLKQDAKIALKEWHAEMEPKAELDAIKTLEQAIKFHHRQLSMNQISEVPFQYTLRLAQNRFSDSCKNFDSWMLSSGVLQRLISLLVEDYKPTLVTTIFAIASKTFKEAYGRGRNPSLDLCSYGYV